MSVCILCRFAYAFFLLLQDSPLGYPTTSNSTVAQVREPLCTLLFGLSVLSQRLPCVQTTMSFVNVFDMTLGAFDIETFRTAPYWMLSVSFFMLFMVFVNIVMLNALIAIMVRASLRHLKASTTVLWLL